MIEPIVNAATHKKALRRIEKLWNARSGSHQERELDALATLVDAYERRAFPIPMLTPIEAITVRCEQLGWSRKELEPLIGSRARVSEVLTGQRSLTLPMIRNIHQALDIPAEILISEQRLPPRSTRGQTRKPRPVLRPQAHVRRVEPQTARRKSVRKSVVAEAR
jgi:HTH-type transcriptional regulator/antitoxin HigA